MKRTKRLLLDEYPLMVLPSLAKEIGLDNAVMLQQIHYWLGTNGKEVEGQEGYWIYNSVEEWHEQCPFWSASTIRRILAHLQKEGLIKTGKFNRDATDHTKWYTIDYDKYDRVVEKVEPKPKRDSRKSTNRIAQNEQIELVNLNTSNYTDTNDTEIKEEATPSQKAKAPKAPPPPQHPFITVYRDEFRRSPNKQQMEQLSGMPTSEKAVEIWSTTLREWALHGWNITNVQGQLEKFNKDWMAKSSQPPQTRIRRIGDKNVTEILTSQGWLPNYQIRGASHG